MKNLKILIIRLSAIGDIVWTTPVIRALKEQLEGVELHYCTKYQYRNIVEHNPYLDKIHYLQQGEHGLKDLITQLKPEKYDYIIDLHKNLRTYWIKFSLRRKSRAYHKLTLNRWLFIKFKINTLPNIHVADRYMNTVKFLGVKPDGKGLDYFIDKNDEVDLSTFPISHQKGFVAFVIGASEPTKKLPFEKLRELCERINGAIILVGGPDEKDEAEALVNSFDGHPNVNSTMPVGNSPSVSQHLLLHSPDWFLGMIQD